MQNRIAIVAKKSAIVAKTIKAQLRYSEQLSARATNRRPLAAARRSPRQLRTADGSEGPRSSASWRRRGCRLRASAARGCESPGPDAAMALGPGVVDEEVQPEAMAAGVL
jgi:hypothetical protein